MHVKTERSNRNVSAFFSYNRSKTHMPEADIVMPDSGGRQKDEKRKKNRRNRCEPLGG